MMAASTLFINELEKLEPLCSDDDDDESESVPVDISFLNAINLLSPVKVTVACSDVNDAKKEIDEAIVRNFAKNYGGEEFFCRTGLESLKSIVQATSEDELNFARKIFVLHATKASAVPSLANMLFTKASAMTIQINVDKEFIDWKMVAQEVVTNRFLNELIDLSISQYGVLVDPNVTVRLKNIVFVNYPHSNLRGFAGVDTIYLNYHHFLLLKNECMATKRKRYVELVLQVDVISIIIHEWSHVKLRQFINDFNCSSPVLAKANGLAPNYNEFGRFIEEQVFGGAFKWTDSVTRSDYLKNVVSAVRNGTMIPKVQDLSGLVIRKSSTLMAFDYDETYNFC